jgi:adenylate kinase
MSGTANKLKKAARIILVGAPGVGKGTQSERLIQRYPQLCSLATGDLLRDHVKRQTSLGKSMNLVSPRALLTVLLRQESPIVYERWWSGPRSTYTRTHPQ